MKVLNFLFGNFFKKHNIEADRGGAWLPWPPLATPMFEQCIVLVTCSVLINRGYMCLCDEVVSDYTFVYL